MSKAESVVLRRDDVDALLRLIDDRWTPPEMVLKRVQQRLRSACQKADWELRADLVCDNCGKTIRQHGPLVECWPPNASQAEKLAT